MSLLHEPWNAITEAVIGHAIKVHRTLGPGLLESVYVACLAHELRKAGIDFDTQRTLPVRYDGIFIDCGFRLDLIVGGQVIVEIKSVKALALIHTAQVLTYLKLTGCPVGLLINFNVPLLKDGLKRVINPRRCASQERAEVAEMAEKSTSPRSNGGNEEQY